MESVSQVNNLTQFVRLVSAARSRNNGLSAGVQKSQNPIQTVLSRAFSNTQPLSAYSYSRQPVNSPGVDESVKTQQTRYLGTRFDAYA